MTTSNPATGHASVEPVTSTSAAGGGRCTHSRPPTLSRSSTIRSRDSSCSPGYPSTGTTKSDTPSVLESFEPPELYDHPLSRDNSDDEGDGGIASVASLQSLSKLRTISGHSGYSSSASSLRVKKSSRQQSRSPAPPVQSATSTKMSKAVGSEAEIRSPLFQDHVPTVYLPGSLHHAPDASIERLIARQGAVTLIRQLAEDLAARDAELVTFRRRAEERERTLKKMLFECEVAALDIERRLAQCGQKPAEEDNLSESETLDDMIQQAMSEVGSAMEDPMDGSKSPKLKERGFEGSRIRPTTPKAAPRERTSDTPSSEPRKASQSSGGKGWKSFLWGSKTVSGKPSGGSSGAGEPEGAKRKPVRPELFVPERMSIARQTSTSSMVSTSSIASPRPSDEVITAKFDSISRNPNASAAKPAVSDVVSNVGEVASDAANANNGGVSSWALKLVGGSSAQTKKQGVKKEPALRPGKTVRRPTAQEDLQRIMKKNAPRVETGKRRRAGSGSNFSGKAPLSEFSSPTIPNSIDSGSRSKSEENLGPVEMDTIVDPAAQPPTLMPTFNEYYPTEYLTDRFGFIYDKRQKASSLTSGNSLSSSLASHTRGSQRFESRDDSPMSSSRPCTPARSENEPNTFEAKTPTTWKDLQKFTDASSSTGINSPFPARPAEPGESKSKRKRSPPVDRVDNKSPPLHIMERMTRPSISMPPRPISTHAFSQLPSRAEGTGSKLDAETATVKLLLGQLSDLHDSLQRDRAIKWNEFLKKVRAHRRKGEGDESGNNPEAALADGELIGVATLGSAGKAGRQKWREFRNLVLGGIPVAYRWKVWAECSGACTMRIPGYYEEILRDGEDDPQVVSQIAMDINRTLTDNVFFRKGPGVSKLKQVLLAYARRNPSVGYCQGMNMIAASLLLIMPSEEDAFWVLASIIENILPKTYFEHSLLASRADQQVLKQYVREILPNLHHHLQDLSVELEALTFQWFLSIFTDCLAAEALFRVWDVLLCIEGSTFLFQVALALLRLNEKSLLECQSAAALYSYLNGSMTHQGISIDGLIHASEAMKMHIKKAEVEKRRQAAVDAELALMGDIAERPITAVQGSSPPNQAGTVYPRTDGEAESEFAASETSSINSEDNGVLEEVVRRARDAPVLSPVEEIAELRLERKLTSIQIPTTEQTDACA